MSIYKSEKTSFFIQSIESILDQTVKPDQIVIVKDGPLTQELDETVELYSKKYSDLISLVLLDVNVGLGSALNAGLKSCRNDLVARMDTDDISFKYRMEYQLKEFINDPNLTIIGSPVLEFYDVVENSKILRDVPKTHQEILKFSRRRSPFNHPTVVFNKKNILKIGGYSSIRRIEDLDLFVRLLQEKDCKAKNTIEPLLYFRSNFDRFRRRKEKINCSRYIDVMRNFYKLKYINLTDYLFVYFSQKFILISPIWIQKLISNKFLRKKI
jgi:glycosyltransferase involved in cell wall biosynthesis